VSAPPTLGLTADTSGSYLVVCRTCHDARPVVGATRAAVWAGLHRRFVPSCPRPDVVEVPLDHLDHTCPCGTHPGCDCD
jgi:hypothetical protein